MQSFKQNFQRGVTLIEVLIIVGILGIVIAIAMPALLNMMYNYQISTAARSMTANMRFARNAAVKQKMGYKIVINDSGAANPNTYVIERDSDNNGTYEVFKNLDTAIPSGVTIDPSSLDEVVFDFRGSAQAQPTAEVLLIGRRGTRYKLTIGLAGSVVMTRVA